MNFLEVSHEQWTKMTPERQAKIEKALKYKVTEDLQKSVREEDSDSISCRKLSLVWNHAHITHLQPDRIAQMWKKAEEILNTSGLVLPAAGNPNARQVASVGGGSSLLKGVQPPHFVFSKKCGQTMEVHCDCPIFRSTPKHALAAAEDMGLLDH